MYNKYTCGDAKELKANIHVLNLLKCSFKSINKYI